jgi:TonB family protein
VSNSITSSSSSLFLRTVWRLKKVGYSGRMKPKSILICLTCLLFVSLASAQTATVIEKRAVKNLVQPTISELAKKLNVTGAVKIEVTIAPDGTVKATRVVGGHPVLAQDAERAARKCTFEPASHETVEIIEFRFNGRND